MKTAYTDPKELRMSAEAFDWIEENMPEVKDLIMAKFAPDSTGENLQHRTVQLQQLWRSDTSEEWRAVPTE